MAVSGQVECGRANGLWAARLRFGGGLVTCWAVEQALGRCAWICWCCMFWGELAPCRRHVRSGSLKVIEMQVAARGLAIRQGLGACTDCLAQQNVTATRTTSTGTLCGRSRRLRRSLRRAKHSSGCSNVAGSGTARDVWSPQPQGSEPCNVVPVGNHAGCVQTQAAADDACDAACHTSQPLPQDAYAHRKKQSGPGIQGLW